MLSNFIKTGALLLGALALAPSAAQAVAGDESIAKILNTSPVYADSGQTYHACNYVNVSTTPVGIKVDLLKSDGTSLASTGAAAITLAPGTVSELVGGTYTGFARCRFTVFAGSDALRANITVFHQTGSYFDSLAISEAR